jgi:hypothetical protein
MRANTGRTVRTKVADEVEDEALEPIRAETIEDIEVDIEGVLHNTSRRNVTFVTRLAAGLLNTQARNAGRRQQASYTTQQEVTLQEYSSFLAQYEGLEGVSDEEPTDQFTALSVEEIPYAPYDAYLMGRIA